MKNKKNKIDELDEASDSLENQEFNDQGSIESPKRSRRSVWLFALIAIFVLLALAPNILGWTGQVESIVNRFVEVNGQIKIGSASLGWLSSINLSNIELLDEAGESVAKIEQVQTSKSLLGFVFNQKRLGRVKIDGAEVDLVTRNGGSNLEDVLAPMMNPKKEPSSSSTVAPIEIQLANSVLFMRRESDSEFIGIGINECSIKVVPEENNIIASAIAETITDDDKRGTVDFKANLTTDLSGNSDEKNDVRMDGTAELSAKAASLTFLEPLVHRFGQSISISGNVNGSINGSWNGTEFVDLSIDRIVAPRLIILAPEYFQRDSVRLTNLSGKGDVKWAKGVLSARQLELKSSFADLQLDGTFDVNEVVNSIANGEMTQSNFSSSGTIDLAALAKSFPGILRVRKDTKIESGSINWQTFSRLEGDNRRIFLNVESLNLNAKRGDQTIIWRKPLSISAAVREDGIASQVEQLNCVSEFLAVNGKGTLQSGNISMNLDLNRLRQRLEQFVDLSDMQLMGDVKGGIAWSARNEQGGERVFVDVKKPTSVNAIGELTINKLLFGWAGQKPLREDLLVAKVDGIAVASGSQLQSINGLTLSVNSDVDHLEAVLISPVKKSLAPDATWEFDILKFQGDAQNWIRRARTFVSFSPMNIQGELDIQGRLSVNNNNVRFNSTHFNANDFRYRTSSFRIFEPKLVGKANVAYDMKTGKVSSPATSLAGSTVAFNLKNFVLENSDDFKMAGKIEYQADLHRLMRWLETNPENHVPYFGKITGDLVLAQSDLTTTAVIKADLTKFKYATSDSPRRKKTAQLAVSRRPKLTTLWEEDLVKIGGKAVYDGKADKLDVQRVRLGGKGVLINGKGLIHKLTTLCRLNITGTLDADSSLIAKRIKDNFAVDIQMQGRQENKFYLRGNMFSPDSKISKSRTDVNLHLTKSSNAKSNNSSKSTKAKNPDDLDAFAQVRWDNGKLYGLPFGKGRAAANVSSNFIDIQPVNLAFSKGKLSIDPIIWMHDDGMLVEVKKGRIFNQTKISPEMCRAWMKYMAPMVAEATSAQGSFSLDLGQDASVPISDPLSGTVDGTLVLHQASIGPGPLGQQFISIAQNAKNLLSGNPRANKAASANLMVLPKQRVAFKVEKGRVYHDNLTFKIRDVYISTTGSVGADQSIDLVATIPVNSKWLEKTGIAKTILQGRIGDKIRIPIRGSLSKPQFQTDIFKNLSKNLVKDAANNLLKEKGNDLLQKGLQKGFEKILGPGKKK